MIEVNSNALFLSTFGVKIDVKNERKRVSRMCEIAYLSIKNPKASRALKRALDPSRRLLASLTRLYFTLSATFGLRRWGPLLTKSWICTCPRDQTPRDQRQAPPTRTRGRYPLPGPEAGTPRCRHPPAQCMLGDTDSPHPTGTHTC